MPNLQSEPDEVHGSGAQDDKSVGELASVSGQELVPEENLICEAMSKVMTENGILKVNCTIKKPHKIHYDEIFSKEWS